jgi:uncharacterized protein
MTAPSSKTLPVVVVTGATEGIGRALTQQFAAAGNRLVLVARRQEPLTRFAEELRKAHGIEVFFTAQDLSTREGCAAVEDALKDFAVHADILVNNAGRMEVGLFYAEDFDPLLDLVNLDIRALMDLTRRFLPGMLARGRGGVLNVASMTGFVPGPHQATYAAAKAFVLSFTRAVAYETRGSGVTVSALAPGPVATKLHAKAGSQRSYYVRLVPVMAPDAVARIAYRDFCRGKRLIVPGLGNRFLALLMRHLPDALVLPVMAWLFKLRDPDGQPKESELPPQG